MPTVAGNRIYVGVGRDAYYNAPRPADEADKLSGKRYYGQGRFMCLELAEAHEPPRLVWEDSEVARTQCTASVVDGLVYVGDMRGFLHCLDADSGRAYWRQDLGYLVECASQMVADGKVYVSNAHNDLMVFTAGRAEPKLLFERRFRSWVATPYPLDGAIVISTQRQISVFETKDEE